MAAWLVRSLKIPLATFTVVLICLILFFADILKVFGYKHDDVCLHPHGIIRLKQVHRIFLHSLFHKGPWHLAITTIPTLLCGSFIERRQGTINFVLVLVTIWSISVGMEVSMATIMYHTVHKLFHECSLGLSGVSFGLFVLSSRYFKSEEFNIGCYRLPFWVIPWTFFGVYYALFHRGSVFMHIGGIIAGYGWKYEVFGCIVPSTEQMTMLEGAKCLQFCVKCPCFVSFRPPILPVHNTVRISKGQLLQAVITRQESQSSQEQNQIMYEV